MRRTPLIALSAALILTCSPVHAQTDAPNTCLTTIQNSVSATVSACAGQAANTACYGGGRLALESRAESVSFTEPGQTLSLADLEYLALNGYDDPNTGYGVTMLTPSADLPTGTLTLAAFGDVALRNLSDAPADFVARPVTVTWRTGANVRTAPKAEAALVSIVEFGRTLTAVGRTEDGTWLLVLLNDDEGQLANGWIASDLVRGVVDFDYDLLRVTTGTTEDILSIYTPMQDFTAFNAVLDDAPCVAAPDSGLLIQTPDLAQMASLRVNGVLFQFAGTVYIQAALETDQETGEGEMRLSVLEGEAVIPSAGDALVSVGQMLTITLDAEGQPLLTGTLTPEEYVYFQARTLPLSLLPREIELPFTLAGLVTPFEPGTGYLTSVPADAACVIGWIVDVNLRAGPGTNYPLRQGAAANQSARPDARAVGSDGQVWWRLAEGVWLLANNTVFGGNCGALPFVDAPPVPTE